MPWRADVLQWILNELAMTPHTVSPCGNDESGPKGFREANADNRLHARHFRERISENDCGLDGRRSFNGIGGTYAARRLMTMDALKRQMGTAQWPLFLRVG